MLNCTVFFSLPTKLTYVNVSPSSNASGCDSPSLTMALAPLAAEASRRHWTAKDIYFTMFATCISYIVYIVSMERLIA